MILVLGGIASGKRTYIESLGYTEADFGGVRDNAPVCYGLEEALREGPLDQATLELLCNKKVVACCEVGSGVVPINAEECAWSELVGHTCIDLAQYAERVIYMVCGIPCTLK